MLEPLEPREYSGRADFIFGVLLGVYRGTRQVHAPWSSIQVFNETASLDTEDRNIGIPSMAENVVSYITTAAELLAYFHFGLPAIVLPLTTGAIDALGGGLVAKLEEEFVSTILTHLD